jgi:hypothetical protein
VPEARAAIAAGLATLAGVGLAELNQVSRWLDPALLGISASGVAFGAVFAARWVANRTDPSHSRRDALD